MIPAAPPGTQAPLPEKIAKDTGEALGETANVPATASIPAAPPTAKGETKTTKAGVKYETLKEGNGEEATSGSKVKVHYVGTLEDGKEFDSSRKRGEPFTFTIGSGGVIQGWDEGVAGMKVGERRKLIVPPSAGYKDKAQGEIPPNSTLVFDIELLGVESHPAAK
jgi:FKBP-type peptidyl-prolyl cis-trans isomerase